MRAADRRSTRTHRPDGPVLDRRTLLRWSGLLGVAAVGGPALVACASDPTGPGTAGAPARALDGGDPGTPALPLTDDLGGLAAPTQLVLASGTAGVLQASWSGGSAPTGTPRYRVLLDGRAVADTARSPHRLTDLDPSRTYAVSVATVTADGAVSTPTAESVRAAATGADEDQAPPYLTAVPTLEGAQLRWAHPGGRSPRPPFAYHVYRSDQSAPVAVLRTEQADPSDPTAGTRPPGTACLVGGLVAGKVHELRLESRDATGARVAEALNRVRVTPYRRDLLLDYDPPTTPTDLAVAARDGGLALTWSAAADDGAGVGGYTVLVDGRFAAQVEGGTAADVAGLANGSPHAVQVAAYDRAGNQGSPCDPVTGTPAAGAPAAAPTPVAAGWGAAGGRLLDPLGREFVPVGANLPGPDFVWDDTVRGRARAAAEAWRWTAVRLSCGLRDWGSVNQSSGYLYRSNCALDALVAEYTGAGVVTILAQHSRGGSDAGTNLPTDAGSAPDGTGRSVEEGLTDWWVAVATAYRDQPGVWFNLVNEPGSDLDALDAQYRRMVARVRAVAPRSVIVLDAAHFANDIPATATIGTGPVDATQSWVLSRAPALVADWGPASGYGPVVASVHLYSRWPGSYGGDGGLITDEQLAARLRDFVGRARAQDVPLLVGEIGVEDAFPRSDGASVRVGLYEQGEVGGATTGVLAEQQVGVLAWHVSRYSGMQVSREGLDWDEVADRGDTAAEPDAGAGLWDYAHQVRA